MGNKDLGINKSLLIRTTKLLVLTSTINLLVGLSSVKSQVIFDSHLVKNMIDHYLKAKPIQTLYLHTDKTSYTNGEQINFAAYMSSDADLSKHKILMVFLVKSGGKTPCLERKFPINLGLSSGNLSLPDSIPSGVYRLMAYSDVLDVSGSPLARFEWPITIRNNKLQSISSRLEVLDSIPKDDLFRVRLTIEELGTNEQAKVTYGTGSDYVRDVVMKGSTLDLEIPENRVLQTRELNVNIDSKRYHETLSIRLPILHRSKTNVGFYPEGGSMVVGLPSQLAIETLDAEGQPVAITGIITQNGMPIDTVKTNTYGVGLVRLIPEANAAYAMLIKGGGRQNRDSLYKIPDAVNNGAVLYIPKAVADTSIKLAIYSSEIRDLNLLLRHVNGAFTVFNVKPESFGKLIKIPLSHIPKGLAAITVIDQEGVPLAERLLVSHYNDSTTVNFKMNKNGYALRDSVTVGFEINGAAGNIQDGIFSVAVVQKRRLEYSSQDIESQFLLAPYLGKLPVDAEGEGFRNPLYIEHVLLTKGWRKFSWSDVKKIQQVDTLTSFQVGKMHGKVSSGGKPVNQILKMIGFGGSSLIAINTDKSGEFKIDFKDLLVDHDQKIVLKVEGPKSELYNIDIYDPFQDVNQKILQQLDPAMLAENNSSNLPLKNGGLDSTISLETVTIKTPHSNQTALFGESGTNECGDYVDDKGFLNDPRSSKRFKPIVGKAYKKRIWLEGSSGELGPYTWEQLGVYTGCSTLNRRSTVSLNGLHLVRTFYTAKVDATEPQYQSTLFWQAFVQTDQTGKATIKFLTGDIPDEFEVVIQGITGRNFVSAKSTIEVK